METTIIYYTSNREDVKFESKIIDLLMSCAGDRRIISISQKPINLGHNICIGNIGESDYNIYRQILIGCILAKTPLIATAEADCIYPAVGYFDYVPEKVDWAYRFDNVWILNKGSRYYRKKRCSLCATVAGRQYMIDMIVRRFHRPSVKDIFYKDHGWSFFHGDYPVVNMKTGNGMRKLTKVGREKTERLPYFGLARGVSKALME